MTPQQTRGRTQAAPSNARRAALRGSSAPSREYECLLSVVANDLMLLSAAEN